MTSISGSSSINNPPKSHQAPSKEDSSVNRAVASLASTSIAQANSDDSQGAPISGSVNLRECDNFSLSITDMHFNLTETLDRKKVEDDKDSSFTVFRKVEPTEIDRKKLDENLNKIAQESRFCFSYYFPSKVYPSKIGYEYYENKIKGFISLMESTQEMIDNLDRVREDNSDGVREDISAQFKEFSEKFQKYAKQLKNAKLPRKLDSKNCYTKHNVKPSESYDCNGKHNNEVMNVVNIYKSLRSFSSNLNSFKIPENFHLQLSSDILQSGCNFDELREFLENLDLLNNSLREIKGSLSDWKKNSSVVVSESTKIRGFIQDRIVHKTMNYEQAERRVKDLEGYLNEMRAYYIAFVELATPPEILKNGIVLKKME